MAAPVGRGRRVEGHTGVVQLWASRHFASGLVALAVLDGTEHPAHSAVLPRAARVVDEATAEIAEVLLHDAAAAAAAAGRELHIDLDEVVDRAQRAARSRP